MNQESARSQFSGIKSSSAEQVREYPLLLPQSLLRLLPYVSVLESIQRLDLTRAKREVAISAFCFLNVGLLALWPQLLTVSTSTYFVWSNWMAFALCVFCAAASLTSFFQIAARGLSERKLRAEVLISISIVLSLVLSLLTVVRSEQPLVLLGTAGFLFSLSLWRFSLLAMIRTFENGLLPRLPKLVEQVRIVDELPSSKEAVVQSSEAKPLASLVEGEFVLVQEGEYVPCDGLVRSGVADIDERSFSGAARQVVRSTGHSVFALSKVISGSLYIEATTTADDSRASIFFAELRERMAIPSALSTLISRSYSGAIWSVLFLTACVSIYWRDQGAEPFFILNTIAVLLVLSLFAPVLTLLAYVRPMGMNSIFNAGALLDSSRILKKLANLKSVSVVYEEQEFDGVGISEFELIDTRVDKGSFLSAVVAILSVSKHSLSSSLLEFVRGELSEVIPFEVSDVTDFDNSGITAIVSGADFSVGPEDFLVTRGVYVEASDIGSSEREGEWYYIAVGRDVIARILVANYSLPGKTSEVAQLRALGVRTTLLALEQAERSIERVDATGKALGFELADIHTGLSEESFADKLVTSAPTALVSQHGFSKAIAEQVELTMNPFEELHWNIKGSSVVLFQNSLTIVHKVIRAARNFCRIERLSIASISLLAAVILVFSALGSLPALTVSASILCLMLTLSFAYIALVAE